MSSLAELPGPPTALTLHQVALAPGESRRFAPAEGPLFLAPFGPAMTFALGTGTGTIRRVPPVNEDGHHELLFRVGPEEPATPGAETALDDVAGIFLPAGATGTFRNNGTEVGTVLVLEIAPTAPLPATPTG